MLVRGGNDGFVGEGGSGGEEEVIGVVVEEVLNGGGVDVGDAAEAVGEEGRSQVGPEDGSEVGVENVPDFRFQFHPLLQPIGDQLPRFFVPVRDLIG